MVGTSAGTLSMMLTFPRRETAQPPRSDDLAALLLSLRHATDADWPFLQALFAGFQAEEMAQLGWPQAEIEALLRDQCRLQHHHVVTCFPGADFWIVEHADRPGAHSPVGRFYLDRSTPLWRIIDIGFLPNARGRGFGSALLKWAQACAADAGAAGIDLHVVVVNWRARQLYQSLGFRAEGEQEGYHQHMTWRPGAQLDPA
jgi:GNAT superfamily N-acetyltransferase